MEKKLMLLGLALLMFPVLALSAVVDTVMVEAPAMKKSVEVVCVLPDKAVAGESCPVLYLLHGYSGHARSWIELKPELREIADESGVIIICPDGKNSWYWDSPKNESYRYETFISSELVQYVDSHYATVQDRKGRAICGLSMGGHGAMWNAIRHKDVFGAVGCMSGGVDIRPFPENWEMKSQLGALEENPEVWEAHTVMTQLDKIADKDLAIIIDCGVDDFFFAVNEELHRQLLARGIEHDWLVRPGAHTGDYWKTSLDYMMVFFNRHF